MNTEKATEIQETLREAAPERSGLRRQVAIVDDRIDSRDLFIGTRELIIRHGSDAYRLRLTAQNKLILTK
jgi:hemin uptake protein HemP